MADRYDERFRPEYGRERYYDEDRGMMDRAGDEVRSWFGDNDAARRRERDERAADRGRSYRRGYESERSAQPRFSERPYARGTTAGSRPGEVAWREEDWGGRREPSDESGDIAPYRRDSGRDFGGGSRIGSGGGFGAAYIAETDYVIGRNYDTGRNRGESGMIGRSAAERSNHAGRGPKGYRRSDERIREDVSDRLTDDPMIDASDIEVTVANAEVTLAGFVREREDKRRSEDIAECISGVREVHNSLRLRRDAETPRETGPMGTSTGRTAGKQSDG